MNQSQLGILPFNAQNVKIGFYGYDICDGEIRYKHQLNHMDCTCPKCNYSFECIDVNIEECGHSEVYRGVLKKKVEWI